MGGNGIGMDSFGTRMVRTGDGEGIFVRVGGSGPPVLLLHGFPETHLMWRGVAPLLAREFTVVCADLRGYGQSACPPSAPDHAPYSKRVMAAELVAVMEALGFARFSVAGHDRGGRVGYRMALDHPETIDRLAVLDIVPTDQVWDLADDRTALGFWPWSFLAQPPPLPERVLSSLADVVIDNALSTWGSPAATFPREVRDAYVAAVQAPGHATAICEEYRAAATIDRDHDHADRVADRAIRCPVLAVWGAGGAVDTWYAGQGGPLALWRSLAGTVEGQAIDGGHFFPEEAPEQTATLLRDFLSPAG
jgi:haloacetate dehalogenase